MPQASDDLRAKFPGSDAEALEAIKGAFYVDQGFVIRKVKGVEGTERQWAAVCYLCDEWDYAYE